MNYKKKDRLYAIAYQILNVVGSSLFVGYLVSLISYEGYGLWVSVNGVCLLISSFLFSGIGNASGRFIASVKEIRELQSLLNIISKYIFRSLVYLIILTFLLCCISIIYHKIYLHYIFLILVYVTFYGLNSVLRNICTVDNKRNIVFYAKFAEFIVKFSLLFYIQKNSINLNVTYILILINISFFVSFIIFLLTTKYKFNFKEKTSKKLTKSFNSFSKPFYVQSLINWVRDWSDKYILLFVVGPKILGEWSIYQQLIVTPLILISSTSISVIYPTIYKEYDKFKKSNYLNKSIKYLLILVPIIFILSNIFDNIIIYIFENYLNKEISNDLPIILVVLLGLISLFLPWIDLVFLLKNKTKKLTSYKLILLMVNSLSLILVLFYPSLYFLLIISIISKLISIIIGYKWQQQL